MNHKPGASGNPPLLPASVPVAILVGGMGTRLREVLGGTVPKPLAPIAGKPFLNLLLHQLITQGFQHVVMCSGFGADQIQGEFGDGHSHGIRIDYSPDPTPLGTAGGLKLACRYVSYAPEFLVMNGDSFLDLDLYSLLDAHRSFPRIATLAVAQVHDASRYGTVQIQNGRLVGFLEKTGRSAPGIINAGVYVFDRSIFDYIPAGWANLEQDVFPRIMDKGVFAVEQPGTFIDIG